MIAGFAFDFTNRFHDTATAMATSIATGALKSKAAVILSACLNFALDLRRGDDREGDHQSQGAPRRRRARARAGGVIGATIVATGSGEVNWHNLIFRQ